jgi:hypothetical protein
MVTKQGLVLYLFFTPARIDFFWALFLKLHLFSSQSSLEV